MFTLQEHTINQTGRNADSDKVGNHDFTIFLGGEAFALEPEQVGKMEDVTFGELRRVIEILNRLKVSR